MKLGQVVLFFAIVVLIFAGGYYFGRVQSSPTQDLQSHAQSLANNEITDYLNEKDATLRCEKAEKALEKVLLVFLYDLGIRIQNSELKKQALAENSPSAKPIADKTVTPEDAPSHDKNVQSETPISQAVPAESESIVARSLPKILAERIYPNPTESWQNAKSIDAKTAKWINGSFMGEVKFSDPDFRKKRKGDWRLEMDIDGKVEKGNFVGNAKYSVIDINGRSFSNTSGNGNQFKHMRMGSDGSLLVDAGNGDILLQFILDPETPKDSPMEFIGNAYLEDETGKLHPKGTLRMSRH